MSYLAFITSEGDKGFNLKQEDFQLVVANSIQWPLVGVRVCIHEMWMALLTVYGTEHVSDWRWAPVNNRVTREEESEDSPSWSVFRNA